MHHVKVAVFCQPNAKGYVDDGFHVGRNHRDAELAPTQLNTSIALRAALYAAFTWQKQHIVIVKYFHSNRPSRQIIKKLKNNRQKKPSHKYVSPVIDSTGIRPICYKRVSTMAYVSRKSSFFH
jgi:hypothetical protein